MKRVVLVENLDKSALKAIRRCMQPGANGNVYLDLDPSGTAGLGSLMEMGFHKQQLPQRDEAFRVQFVREYIELIGAIGKENNTLAWWATDMASKNRFTCRTPSLLIQFFDIMETAQQHQSGTAVVIKPDWVLIASIKKACADRQIACIEGPGFARQMFLSIFTGRLRTLASNVYHAGRVGIRSIHCRLVLGSKIKSLLIEKKAHYVVKTFIYDSSFSQAHVYKDVFFGRLPNALSKNKDVLVLGAILGDYSRSLREIKACNVFGIIPVEFFAHAADMATAFMTFLTARMKLTHKGDFFGFDVAGIVRNELARTANGIQYYQLLHYWMVKRFLENVKTESFLLTYENNPWEKMCLMAIREVSPGTKIMGYQHTIVSQASANMFRSRSEKDVMPSPDMILTVGEAPKRIIERYGDYPDGYIRPSCGLRFEYLFGSELLSRKNRGTVLVALEGIKGVDAMVEFVLRQLGNHQRYAVRIRTHPVLTWDYFKQRGLTIEGKRNFELSRGNSLRADLAWADIVVYWGSTIALEALTLGLPVVHYRNGSLLSLDPLFECSHLKRAVSKDMSLTKVLDEMCAMDDADFVLQQGMAQRYLSDYFNPVNEANMAEFFNP